MKATLHPLRTLAITMATANQQSWMSANVRIRTQVDVFIDNPLWNRVF